MHCVGIGIMLEANAGSRMLNWPSFCFIAKGRARKKRTLRMGYCALGPHAGGIRPVRLFD